MTHCKGFDAVARADAQLLILGSLPGAESLRQHQYYAKKQNSFWRIMGSITGALPDLPYEKRLKCLMKHRIALWDVCTMAVRKGSLDADIHAPAPNDFKAFFSAHPRIKYICFNGQSASKIYTKLVKPQLLKDNFSYIVLPSTSPAHAGMRYEEKLARWRRAIEAR